MYFMVIIAIMAFGVISVVLFVRSWLVARRSWDVCPTSSFFYLFSVLVFIIIIVYDISSYTVLHLKRTMYSLPSLFLFCLCAQRSTLVTHILFSSFILFILFIVLSFNKPRSCVPSINLSLSLLSSLSLSSYRIDKGKSFTVLHNSAGLVFAVVVFIDCLGLVFSPFLTQLVFCFFFN
jgi:hypothetical protein